MCGISAYINCSTGITPGHEEIMRKNLEFLRPRGPDGEGIAKGRNWLLGHTRLAIIDPASGTQPWTDPESGAYITYNGEIYNFRELRSELAANGRIFRTDCDTEVVLAAYLEWGERCLEKFDGFFAFAIVDPVNNILFAARDRIGIKPFHYYAGKGEFCICSTIPGILNFIGRIPEIDLETMSHYLSVGRLTFGDRTLLRGIKTLLPGHSIQMSLDDAQLTVKRYWKRPIIPSADKEISDFDTSVQECRELITNSVRRRLLSDVPLGAFLSGGLDSAIITTLANRDFEGSLPVFCAGTGDASTDEFQYARTMAKQLDTELREITIAASDFSKDWRMLIGNKGEPLTTPNEISIYHLARALRKECAVTLTGEGADEIFGGYIQPHFSAYDFDRSARTMEDADMDSPFAMAMVMLYGRNFFINDTDHYLASCSWLPYEEKAVLFQPEVWESIEEDAELFGFYEDFFETLEGCSSFDKRMHLHAEFNLENLLARVDNSTMSASVEARVPFNDHKLVEFAFRAPDEFKMDWKNAIAKERGKNMTAAGIDREDLLESKKLSRCAFKSELPESIVERRKMSFPLPFEKWFSGPLLTEIKPMCMQSKLGENILNKDYLNAALANPNRNLWLIANLCAWWEELNRTF